MLHIIDLKINKKMCLLLIEAQKSIILKQDKSK